MLRTLTARTLAAYAVVGIALLPLFASAAALPSKIVPCNGADCTVCSITDLAQNVLNTGIYIAVFLGTLLFAYAGWQYLTAGGDSGKAGKAKAVFTNVMVGMVIILIGWLVIDVVMNTLTKVADWYKLC